MREYQVTLIVTVSVSEEAWPEAEREMGDPRLWHVDHFGEEAQGVNPVWSVEVGDWVEA